METIFRQYDSQEERIALDEIRQIPTVEGIVGTLMDIPGGEVWPRERIKELREEVESRGLTLKVIESVNVHDAIKISLPSHEQYIGNYKQTIRNLAEYGVEVIYYNFMPIFDWVKSDLDYCLEDGSSTLAFISADIPADPKKIVERIEQSSNELELPGWESERLAHIKSLLEVYASIDEEKLRENFAHFL